MNSMNMMVPYMRFIFILLNHCLSVERMIRKSMFGITKDGNAMTDDNDRNGKEWSKVKR